MTYRERRLARAERLRGWAEKREQVATAQLNSNPEMRQDHAFNTQPGHIPERARIIARDDRAFESLKKAQSMETRAAGIEAQVEKAIYSDDQDAPERLKEKIAALEAQRDHAKAVNKAIRATKRTMPGAPGHAILVALGNSGVIDHREAMALDRSFVLQPYHGLGYPAYHITNLGANIRRQKERLAEIERAATEGPRWHYYSASKYESVCVACQESIAKGTAIAYRKGTGEAQHFTCYEKATHP
jgi:uncharacterized protein DUF3560